MNVKINISIFLLLIFASCAKESIDETIINNGEIETEIIACALEVEVSLNAENSELSASPHFGLPPYTYKWSSGDNSQNIQNVASGSYALEVVDSQGCEASSTVDMIVSSDCGSVFGLIVSHDESALTLTATVQSAFGYFLEWSTGESLETIIVESGQSYSVQVINQQGCILVVTYDIP